MNPMVVTIKPKKPHRFPVIAPSLSRHFFPVTDTAKKIVPRRYKINAMYNNVRLISTIFFHPFHLIPSPFVSLFLPICLPAFESLLLLMLGSLFLMTPIVYLYILLPIFLHVFVGARYDDVTNRNLE